MEHLGSHVTKNKLALASLLLLGIHVFATAFAGSGVRAALVCDTVLLPVSLLTAVACFLASRRSLQFARSFWFVMGTAFTLWTLGDSLDIYQELTVRSWPITQTLLYFISITAIFLTVFGTNDEAESGGVHWSWVLDAMQILVLILAGYLFFIYEPTLMHGPESVHPVRLSLLHWRNIALGTALAVRVLWSRDDSERWLFAPLAFAIGLYSLASFFGNRA
ncbi:MAG: hypothetical protein ACRD3E_17260, partial [Terriglobales bacterium]